MPEGETMSNSAPNTITIIGAGKMGKEVTWACLYNGLKVKLFDKDSDTLEAADNTLLEWLSIDLKTPEAGATAIGNLQLCRSIEQAVNGSDLVFENVPEDLNLKRQVHAEIENYKPDHAIQGTNASALKGSNIAAALKSPDRFFNMNFTFPRAGNRLVEVMPNPDTDPETLHTAIAWATSIGMIPIAAQKESLGYIQNRIWRAIKKECLFLIDQGFASPSDIDRGFMLAFGMEIGPCALMDKVGLPTVKKIEDVYFEESGDPSDAPPPSLIKMIEEGRLGEQSGSGFYDYPNPAYAADGWLETGETSAKAN